jgi:hypothetical protein
LGPADLEIPMSHTSRRLLTLVLLVAVCSALAACGGSSRVDEETENVGPGPGLAMISHGGITGHSYLPYWGLYVNGTLFRQGSNLLKNQYIYIELPGVAVGSAIDVWGFNMQYDPITSASGVLGPMGVVLQMP